MEREACCAAVYGVTKSQTQLRVVLCYTTVATEQQPVETVFFWLFLGNNFKKLSLLCSHCRWPGFPGCYNPGSCIPKAISYPLVCPLSLCPVE